MAAIAAGVVISVGGLTESVVKHASGALITWCQNQVRDQFDCDGLCVCCVVVCVCVCVVSIEQVTGNNPSNVRRISVCSIY